MKIEFVNHACYVLSAGGVRMIVDPWLEGTAFHNGWALTEPTRFSYDRFSEITHIWFSHEHPDHFSPPNLKKIPEHLRKHITILFQKTRDRKVVDFCRSIGFEQVIELGRNWTAIAPGFEMLNRPHTDGDSWLAVRSNGRLVLNVNDCNLETDREVRTILKAIGAKPEVLFTQFSYANAMGNRPDTHVRAAFASAKLEEVKRQIRILEPKYVIPFASFVWFCHQENFFRNDAINTVDKVVDVIGATPAIPVLLFNGDIWSPDEPAPTSRALGLWNQSYAQHIREENAQVSRPVSEEDLRASAAQFILRLKQKNNGLLLNLWLKPTVVFVRDLHQAYSFSLSGLVPVQLEEHACDVAIGSEALHYCFQFEWGGSTTRINGRYEVPDGAQFTRFKRYFLVSQLNNQGLGFGVGYVMSFLISAMRSKFAS